MRSTILRAVLGLFLITVAACGNSANRTDPRPDLQPSDDTTERLISMMTTTSDGLLAISDEAGAKALLGETDFNTLVEKVNDLNIKIAGGSLPRLASVWDLASLNDGASSAQRSARITPECKGCVLGTKCTVCVLWVFCLKVGPCST